MREAVALLLCVFAGLLAVWGYLRWLRNEKAMRLRIDLPYTRALPVISAVMVLAAVIVIAMVLYAG